MRSRILTSLMLSLAVAPAWSARAQDAEDQDTEAGSEMEGAEVVDEAPEPAPGAVTVPPGAPRGRDSAPGQVHSVQEGDTLWDLSQRYLGSPWYWPKVWSYNPEIANPHWIYPGNQVRFFAGGEEVPARVEPGTEMVVDEGDVTAPVEMPGAAVTVTGKIGYDVSTSRPVTTQGFVTQRELDEAGRIEGSSSGALMLSFPDHAYVRFKKKGSAKVGDRYVVFHTTQEINHPVTGKKLGFLTDFLGTLRVVRINENVVTAQVVDTWDGMERGDLVGPVGERLTERIAPRPNTKEVQATVITALVPYLTQLGEHHTVVMDRGSADGVQLGNTFTILRRWDPALHVLGQGRVVLSDKEKRLPWEDIGTCMVTEVKERTSNCLMLRSLEELVPGDRAVMRVSQPTASR
ncbi:LysM peptidoglycan-binding domain-containing protein [Myxococcus sp. RHSTA-1-4]|uniref:LysM peptidoglycan-binding domain-containing protein n=1 Tax=Myxococcus sp. RHSTA-1-4 TaxID=2874601 RepID=UPI001CBC635B|nr:LysM peptidoglycan-binding domain-containing protein [Myxococcus sp. RHSTA-1-4]MBZ4415927.1 LysM peptidoglycan-binding domain-containing protein [Myxococcus sp. RHSTA-1-4]